MTEEKNTDMVKYRNEFNLTNLNKLDKIEQDILFTMCSQLTTEKRMETAITFSDLRKKAFFTERNYNWNTSIDKIRSLGEKITSLKFVIDKEKSFAIMPLFSKFWADDESQNITVKLNSEFAHYLFDIPEKIGFSRFELEQFIFLKSKYSKTLFRFLLQNYKGKWIVNFEDLKEILGFPQSYGANMIIKKIKSIIPELENTGYFSNIEMDYTKYNLRGSPMKDVIFSYKINKEKALESKGQIPLNYKPVIEKKEKVITKVVSDSEELPHLETKKETIKEEKKCPKCGSKVISRVVTGETANKGRKYEKCEKNDLKNQQCKYFKWLDE